MSDQPEEGYVPSGVWRIRGPSNTVYLAGTHHVVAEDQIPFPSPYYAAYQDSQEVYAEVEPSLSLFTTIRLLPKLFKWMRAYRTELICPKDRNLADYLSAETVERLRTFYGKDYPKKERYTPLFLVLMAEGMDNTGLNNGGVEDVFIFLARKERKPFRTLDDKASMLELAVPYMEELLQYYRRDIAQKGVDAVVEENILSPEEDDLVWRRGDMTAVEHFQAKIRSEMPLLYEHGVVERNHRWLPKLKSALQAKKNVMVLVGVAHLGGEDGLLALLRQAGFTVEQMYGVDRPELANHFSPRQSGRSEHVVEKRPTSGSSQ